MKRTIVVVSHSSPSAASRHRPRPEDTEPAYTFKFSGYFKADFVYDQTRVNSGNYALYVMERNPIDAPDNDVMSITARESRFGLDFWWKENDIRTDARLEFDFYGLGVSPREPQLDGEQGRADAPARVREAHEGAAGRCSPGRRATSSRPSSPRRRTTPFSGIRATSATAGRSSGSRPGRTCPITGSLRGGRHLPHARRRPRRRQDRRRRRRGHADLPGTARDVGEGPREGHDGARRLGALRHGRVPGRGGTRRASTRGPGTSISGTRPAIAGSSWASSSSAITSAPTYGGVGQTVNPMQRRRSARRAAGRSSPSARPRASGSTPATASTIPTRTTSSSRSTHGQREELHRQELEPVRERHVRSHEHRHRDVRALAAQDDVRVPVDAGRRAQEPTTRISTTCAFSSRSRRRSSKAAFEIARS